MLKKFVHPHPTLHFTHSLPYGALLHDAGVQFVVFSRSATAMRVLLYDNVDDREPSEIISFDRDTDRWGDIWSVFVPGLVAGQLYHFQADGPFEPHQGQRFKADARLLDPYARALAGRFMPHTDGIVRPPKCVVVDDERTFVTSANFTEAAQDRNIEVGVLVEGTAFASSVTEQFVSLVRHARLLRIPGL